MLFCFTPFILFSQTPTLYGPPGSRTIDLCVNSKDPSIIDASNYEGGLFRNYENEQTKAILTMQGASQIRSIYFSYFTGETFFYASDRFIKGNENTYNWTLIHNDADNPIFPLKHFIVNPIEVNVMYTHRYGKELWRSDDCGENWYLLYTFENDIDRIAIAPSDSSILYVVALGLYKSIDSGKNWYKIFENYNFGNSAWQLKVNPQNPHSVYLQGGGNLYKAIGEHDNVDTTIIYNLSDYIIDPKDTLTMYVAASDPWFGTGGGMIKSSDGGENWFSIINGLPYDGTTVMKLAIDPINTSILYAGTSGRGVYKTTDGGENWELTNLVNDGSIINYEVLDSQTGSIIALSYSWHIIKTLDNGNTWIKPEFFPNENNWDINTYSISFNSKDKNIGYHGDGTDLFKTTDGGTTWVKTDDVVGCKSVVFHKFNPDIIYAQDMNNMRYISEDEGESWTELFADYGLPVVFSSVDEKVGYYPSGRKIMKTTDLGRTWHAYDSGFPKDIDGNLKVISTIDIVDYNPQVLYGTTMALHIYKGALSKSTDGGESWFQVDSSLQELDPMISISSVCVDQENSNRLFVGLKHHGTPYAETFSNGGLYLSEDECKSWKKIFDSSADNIKIDYTTTPKTIYFTTKFGLMSLPDTAHNILPKEFALYQNYPNPFNPATSIQYNIPAAALSPVVVQHVSLKVYDILGREVVTLVNENQKPGNYEVNFNAADLPAGRQGLASGIYFYELQSGGLIRVKKMILLR
jgi:photosystem II stability/assembly factor-like uncharacterized protein